MIIQSSNYVQNTFWQSGSDSKWFLNKKMKRIKLLMAMEMTNVMKDVHICFNISLMDGEGARYA